MSLLNPGELTNPVALVRAHLAGDAGAFGHLDRLYRRRLMAFASRMVQDADRAEEIVQETFFRVFRHGHRFDPSRDFSTWIFTIAGNLARDELRRRKRRRTVALESLPPGRVDQVMADADEGVGADVRVESEDLVDLVRETAADLPAGQREVFVLREMEGMSYGEIAERLRCDLGTVKSRLNRARRQVAASMREQLAAAVAA